MSSMVEILSPNRRVRIIGSIAIIVLIPMGALLTRFALPGAADQMPAALPRTQKSPMSLAPTPADNDTGDPTLDPIDTDARPMAFSGTLTSPGGWSYEVSFEREPTQEDIESVMQDIARRESNTGQSRGEATAAAFGRGVLGLFPSVVQGVGAGVDVVTPGDFGQGLRRRGQEMQADLEEALPVNPVYEDEFGVKAAEALGQGVTFLGLGVASGGSPPPVLNSAMVELEFVETGRFGNRIWKTFSSSKSGPPRRSGEKN